VRADAYASFDQKLLDLAALEDITFSRDAEAQIISLSEARWQVVQQEAILVLEQIMRTAIREDRLEEARRNVPNLVSLSLTEDQATLVAELVIPFVAPNRLYNAELTDEARRLAGAAIEPITRSYITNENIVQRGQVISAIDLEALQAYGLGQPVIRWQDLVSAALFTMLICAFFTLYLRRNTRFVDSPQGMRNLWVLAALFLVFLVIGRLTIPGHTVIPYLFPLMAYSLTMAALFGSEVALISVLPLGLLITYGLPNMLDLMLFYVLSSVFGVWALGRAQRVTSFFRSGAAIVVSGAMIATGFRLLEPTADWIGLATLAGAAVLNGIASASLGILLHFFIAQFLGITTSLQLIELSRPDHPLMQYILRNAPGTYQHSLQIANLAEQAAEQIGADPLLTRVGALYHDAGKALNPYFFIENQPPGNLNPHDDLDPAESAATIIQHVTEGVELARKYRLPARVLDFIGEHHGTMLTRYQYVRAVEAANGDENLVDPEQFRYPGPRPQSRETALIMLADGCEARMRAERPKDEEELRVMIQNVIDNRMAMHQLDATELTLRDLNAILESFITTLRGVYHPRIQYPKLTSQNAPLLTEPITRPLIGSPHYSAGGEIQADLADLTTSASENQSVEQPQKT
jgi:hypothetical protein